MFSSQVDDDYYTPANAIDEILEKEKLEYQENTNPLRADELKDPHRRVKMDLLSIIATYQDPVCSQRIFKDWELTYGTTLNPNDYGFRTFSAMMRTFTDKFIHHDEGTRTTYTAKKTERSGHIQDLVEHQITPEERRRKEQKRARSFSRSRKSNYGMAFEYYQKFVPLPDERSADQRVADNLASFGRSLAAERGALNWGGARGRPGREESTTDDESLAARSRSVPSSRPSSRIISDDPAANKDDLEDCMNPFRKQHNIRIRDLTIAFGEEDGTGRKGIAVMTLAPRFKEEARQPLGGIPNLSEDKLFKRMSKVETDEWSVERMPDGVVYVIVSPETIQKANMVGPGTETDKQTGTVEKPSASVFSPGAQRMLSFAVKGATSHNSRVRTKEKVVEERLNASCAAEDGEIVVDGVGKVQQLQLQQGSAFDREEMVQLNENIVLDAAMYAKCGEMLLLRTQPSTRRPCDVAWPPSSSSDNSTTSTRDGSRRIEQNRVEPHSSSTDPMSSIYSNRFAPKKLDEDAPSFGTFKSNPARLAADTDGGSGASSSSEILAPTPSSIFGKLPTGFKSAASEQPSSTRPSSGFPSMMGGASGGAAARPSAFGGGATAASINSDVPRFGTGSKDLTGTNSSSASSAAPIVNAPRPNLPTFGAPSGFGGRPTPTLGGAPAAEAAVKEEKKNGGGGGEAPSAIEIIGAVIQLIGRLRNDAIVFVSEVEGTPVEDVLCANFNVFDIAEDDRIYLVDRTVDVRLLQLGNSTLGEMEEEERQKMAARRPKIEQLPPPSPSPMGFAARETPSFGTFSRPSGVQPQSQQQQSEPIKAKPLEGMPSFGTINKPVVGEADGRPQSALGMTSEKPRDSQQPSFARASAAAAAISGSAFEKRVHFDTPYADLPTFGAPTSRPAAAAAPAAPSSFANRPMPYFGDASKFPPCTPSSGSRPGLPFPSQPSLPFPPQPSAAAPVAAAAAAAAVPDEPRPASALSTASTADRPPSVLEMRCESRLEKEAPGEKKKPGKYAWPGHAGITALSRQEALAFDASRAGEMHVASVITSYEPNRLVLTMVEEGSIELMMERVMQRSSQMGMAYSDEKSLMGRVEVGQLAVAISGPLVVRVVVLRELPRKEDEESLYDCACLDINAMITVDEDGLYELKDPFGLKDLKSWTFVAEFSGSRKMRDLWHQAVLLVAKNAPGEDSIKVQQPVVLHGIDKKGAILMDVLALAAEERVWMGEFIMQMFGEGQRGDHGALLNPDIKQAIAFALDNGLEEYADALREEPRPASVMSDSSPQREQEQLTEVKPEPVEMAEQQQQQEAVADDESTTSSEPTTVVMGGEEGRDTIDVKTEEPAEDEFVVVAPPAQRALVDVDGLLSLVARHQRDGEPLEAQTIKSMAMLLLHMANKKLSSHSEERGALIANAEALQALDGAF